MPNHSDRSKNPGCLASLLRVIGIQSAGKQPEAASQNVEYLPADPEPDEFPYRLRDDFLSPSEKSFYLVLKKLLGEHLTICSKVSLGDLFFVVRPNENRSAHNRINRKHVDFLICDPRKMVPLFAVELDDRSHERADRVERDEFVDGVFEAAGLPLLHIAVRASYSTTELAQLVRKALAQRGWKASSDEEIPAQAPISTVIESRTQGSTSVDQPAPFCPKCGSPMVLRMARSGDQNGRQFYGCSSYPKCRTIIPVEIAGN